MDTLPDAFWTALGDRYTVERLLGRGGMATVYLAQDHKHDRPVAIKVLRAELAGALGQERFLREIRITAQLDHPHIVALLDSGSAHGLLYFVMPWVDGESLRERLGRERRLPIEEALRIAREVADALDHAHARGVVHRDVKPENILLAGGHARVADFGIARALAASGAERLTQTGMAIGTPSYMSPEQAAGEASDHRVDIFALGCLLYEMLVGAAAYPEEGAAVAPAQQLARPRPSARGLRREVPVAVDGAIRRALTTAPAARFATARAFAAALDPAPARAARRRLLGVGVALITAVVALVTLRRGDGGSVRLAVIPRAAAGGEPAGYFVEGVAEVLGIELMRVPGVTVVAHESAHRLEGEDPRRAADRLGVKHVVLVTARRGGDKIHVTVRLVDDRGNQRWAGSYDREPSVADLVALQRDVAHNVAGELGGFLGPHPAAPDVAAPTTDFDAYDLLMRGRFFWTRRGADNLVRAAADLERAIALDSTLARAHVALAQTYLLFPVYAVEAMPPATALAMAEKLARTGLKLDSTLGEAHAALGVVHELRHHDWPAARRAFARAMVLSPRSATVQQWYGQHLLVAREPDAALRALRQAYELDPLSPAVSNSLAIGLHATGDDSTAIAQIGRTLAADSSYIQAHLLLAAVYLQRRQFDSVAASLMRFGIPRPTVGTLVAALAGQRPASDALGMVAALEGRIDLETTAALYAGLHANERALDVMARALQTPGSDLTEVFAPLPLFDELAATPRYGEMLESIGVRAVGRVGRRP